MRLLTILITALTIVACNSEEKKEVKQELKIKHVEPVVITRISDDYKDVTQKPEVKTKGGYPFIKLDAENVNTIDDKTANELITSALSRFYQYVYSDTITGHELVTLKKGHEIGISEDLFKYIKWMRCDAFNEMIDSDPEFKKGYIETLKNTEVESKLNDQLLDEIENYRKFLKK